MRLNWPNDAAKNELQLFYPTGPTHGGPVLADNDWHHVLFVFYGNTALRFGVASRVDVVFDGQPGTINRDKFTSAIDLGGQLFVGAAGEDFSLPFHGRIDELAIYDLSHLSVEEIEARSTDIAQRHIQAARPYDYETSPNR